MSPPIGWEAYTEHLITRFVEKDGLPLPEAKSKARDHSFWKTLGYNYEELMEGVRKHDRKVRNKEVQADDGLPRELWKELNSKRDLLPKKMSASKEVTILLKYCYRVLADGSRVRNDSGAGGVGIVRGESGDSTIGKKVVNEEVQKIRSEPGGKGSIDVQEKSRVIVPKIINEVLKEETVEEGEYVKTEDKKMIEIISYSSVVQKLSDLSNVEIEQWGEISRDIEMELANILGYCMKVKQYSVEWRNVNPYKIILELARLVKDEELTLKKVKSKLVEEKDDMRVDASLRLFKKVFGGGKKTKPLEVLTGANNEVIGDKDIEEDKDDIIKDSKPDIFRDLFDRFCLYVIRPESMAEDMMSSKELVGLLLEEEMVRYKKARDKEEWTCPPSHHSLHSFLFYDYRVRALISGPGLERSLEELNKDRDKMDKLVKEVKRNKNVESEVWQKTLGKMLLISSSPSTCLPHIGELAMVSDSRLAKMVGLLVKHVASLGSLDELESALKNVKCMSKKEKLIQVMELFKLDSLPEHTRVHNWVFAKILLEYFTTVGCKITINTRSQVVVARQRSPWPELVQFLFSCYLEQAEQMTREQDGKLAGFSLGMVDRNALTEAVVEEVTVVCETGLDMYKAVSMYLQGTLFQELKKIILKQNRMFPLSPVLVRLIYDFIDCTVKQVPHFLPILKRNKDKLTERVVDLLGNGQMVSREKLNKISYDDKHKNTIKISIVEIEDNDKAPSLTPVSPPDSLPYSAPASLYIEKEVVLPPKATRTFPASLAGLPSLHSSCPLLISPKRPGLLPDVTPLLPDQTVNLRMSNTTSLAVKLTPGLILGSVHPRDWTSCDLITPAYCLQLVRQMNMEQRLLMVEEPGCMLEIGCPKINVKKNQKTNFSITGSFPSLGIQDYYNVEAVVYFLQMMQNTASYKDYVRAALIQHKQVVKEDDYRDMLGYMSGKTETVCHQVRNKFDKEDCIWLEKLLQESKLWDLDLGLEDINKDLESEFPDPKEMVVSPNKLLIRKLGRYLVYDFDMGQQQAKETIRMVVNMLIHEGYDLNALRLEYNDACNRKIFEEILLEKLVKVLKGKGLELNVMLRSLAADNLKKLTQPSAGSEDFKSFLGLASYFKTTLDSRFNLNLEKFSKQNSSVEKLSAYYHSLLEHMADPKNSSPLTQSGPLKLYSSTSKHSQASLLVQLQDKVFKPVSFSMRQLTPGEREQLVYKVEREAVAVLWALEANMELFEKRQLTVVVNSQRVKEMFEPGPLRREHTAYWWEEMVKFGNFNVEFERLNPVLVLAKHKKAGMEMGYMKVQLIQEVVHYMLLLIKRSSAGWKRWVRRNMETLEKEGQMVETGPVGEVKGESVKRRIGNA
eukprot:GFUD01022026.1.p1 GENE.GFUD01022026.1~~GFUD01022026.1.p1  ORF type:complete len:1357 (+),score=468.72 GFUD01022026.1:35-4105(+)